MKGVWISMDLVDKKHFNWGFLCRLHDSNGEDIYLAFNAHDYFIEVYIPPPPIKRKWFSVVSSFPLLVHFPCSIFIYRQSLSCPYTSLCENQQTHRIFQTCSLIKFTFLFNSTYSYLNKLFKTFLIARNLLIHVQ